MSLFNALKRDVLSAAYTLFWVMIGVLFFTLFFLWLTSPQEPLHDYSEAGVLNTETLETDGFALVRLERCSRAEEPVGVLTSAMFQFSDGFQFTSPSTSIVGIRVLPGCNTYTTRVSLPSGPLFGGGEWRVVGWDIYAAPRIRQTVIWTSEPFSEAVEADEAAEQE